MLLTCVKYGLLGLAVARLAGAAPPVIIRDAADGEKHVRDVLEKADSAAVGVFVSGNGSIDSMLERPGVVSTDVGLLR